MVTSINKITEDAKLEMKNFYQVKIQEAAGIADEGCAFIKLPTELLDHLGWKVGNNLVWEETEIVLIQSRRKIYWLH